MTFANKITVTRIVAVPFFIGCVFYYSPSKEYLRYWALGVFSFAVVTDFVDGYIARTRDQKTLAGAMLDPLADKILLISAFICLYNMGPMFSVVQPPMWLVVGVISRDVILILGCAIIHLIHGQIKIQPTLLGKGTSFFQICCVIGILLQISYVSIFWHVTLFFTVVSCVDYIRIGIRTINSRHVQIIA